MSYVNWCKWEIITAEGKVFPVIWTSIKAAVNIKLFQAESKAFSFNAKTNLPDESASEKHYLCPVSCGIKKEEFVHATISVPCQATAIVIIETYCNVLELQCSKAGQHLIDTLPTQPFQAHIVSSKSKLTTPGKLIVVCLGVQLPHLHRTCAWWSRQMAVSGANPEIWRG